jgi:hypothetical protein
VRSINDSTIRKVASSCTDQDWHSQTGRHLVGHRQDGKRIHSPPKINMQVDLSFLGPITAALIAAFLGSWAGSIAGLSKFKKERAFDKRLQWYEGMIGVLLDTARELAIARTFENGFRNGEEDGEERRSAWKRVQHKHLEVNRLTAEGVLFAKRQAFGFLWDQTTTLQELADDTCTFENVGDVEIERLNEVKRNLREAANVLAGDIRGQLGLDPLGTHPRDSPPSMRSVAL